MSQLQLFNNLSKQKEVFQPQDENRVTMYVCGPTVYSHPHIGNARPAVVFDVLYRVLQQHYDNVVYARNITDIEDKIITAAKEANVEIKEITDKYAKIYHQDLDALYVKKPSIEPYATEHIDEMIAMIERLIQSGHAYEADGHVLFDISQYADYGKLSRRSLEDMVAGARVEVATYKKNPGDFVLWKPSTEDKPGWPSPWLSDDNSNLDKNTGKGLGRPGWHIECSSMIEKHLGNTIDIHGGGHDLIFPHHENEIAQSTCSHNGAKLANYWLHNGFVNMGVEKMSKSLGNILLVKDLLDEHHGETVRMALLSTHYRKPVEWTESTTEQAKNKLDRLYRALEILPQNTETIKASKKPSPELMQALNDDLNTPLAIDCLSQLANSIQKASSENDKLDLASQLLTDANVLGLLNHSAKEWFEGENVDDDLVSWINSQIERRQQAKKEKDFATADAVRDELKAKGIDIKDTPNGVTWQKA